MDLYQSVFLPVSFITISRTCKPLSYCEAQSRIRTQGSYLAFDFFYVTRSKQQRRPAHGTRKSAWLHFHQTYTYYTPLDCKLIVISEYQGFTAICLTISRKNEMNKEKPVFHKSKRENPKIVWTNEGVTQDWDVLWMLILFWSFPYPNDEFYPVEPMLFII